MITVTVAGRVGKDSELRQAGQSNVLSFSVACDTGFGDRKQSHWFNCSLWGNQGAALQQYLLKGQQVTIVGEFSEREHNGKQYKELRVNQIELQGGGQQNQQPNNQQHNPQQRQAPQQNQFNNQMSNQQQAPQSYAQPKFNEKGEELDGFGNVKNKIPF